MQRPSAVTPEQQMRQAREFEFNKYLQDMHIPKENIIVNGHKLHFALRAISLQQLETIIAEVQKAKQDDANLDAKKVGEIIEKLLTGPMKKEAPVSKKQEAPFVSASKEASPSSTRATTDENQNQEAAFKQKIIALTRLLVSCVSTETAYENWHEKLKDLSVGAPYHVYKNNKLAELGRVPKTISAMNKIALDTVTNPGNYHEQLELLESFIKIIKERVGVKQKFLGQRDKDVSIFYGIVLGIDALLPGPGKKELSLAKKLEQLNFLEQQIHVIVPSTSISATPGTAKK